MQRDWKGLRNLRTFLESCVLRLRLLALAEYLLELLENLVLSQIRLVLSDGALLEQPLILLHRGVGQALSMGRHHVLAFVVRRPVELLLLARGRRYQLLRTYANVVLSVRALPLQLVGHIPRIRNLIP